MSRRGRGAADQERAREALALHFARDVHHLIERGSDEAREPDEVDFLAPRGLEDLVVGNHDPKVDHFEIIALQYDAYDVLADIVHVALDGGDHHASVGARRANL